MDKTDTNISGRVVSRRAVVQTGMRLAYAAPLISASYSLTTLTAAADEDPVSPDEAAKLVGGSNTPPIAVPGEGFEVEDLDGDGVETVSVDGSSSADPDGKILSYSWSFGDEVFSRKPKGTVELPIGTHRLVLTVTDDQGESASAKIRIRVKDGPAPQEPTETPAPDEEREPDEQPAPDPEQESETLPPPPYEVEAKQKNAEIAITWKVKPEVQPPYHVYRALDDGLEHTEEEIDEFDWLLIREEWEKLSYRDADVQVGVPYLYAVRSFDGVNESERSNIVKITMEPIPDEPPADTPTPEPEQVIEDTPTPTVKVVPDTPIPTEVIDDTPTEAPPSEDEGESEAEDKGGGT
jgi:hypothetical protein